jgi:hypothetical protein
MEPTKVPGALYPIYFHDGAPLPAEGTYYVIAQDGMYMVKDTGLIQATVKVEKFSMLEKLPVNAKLRLPVIPAATIAQALLFFRRVYERFRAEAVVMLYYSPIEKNYLLDVFGQEVSGASAHSDIKGKFADLGYQLVGTIHSHCDFSAFHSSVDVNNEKDFDGIHITIGHVDQPYFTLSCTAVVNNNRFPLEPVEVIKGALKVEHKPVVCEYPNYRRRFVPHQKSLDTSSKKGGILDGFMDEMDSLVGDFLDLGFGLDSLAPYTYPHVEPPQYYDLALPEGMDYRHCRFPDDWISRVSLYAYKAAKPPGKLPAADKRSSEEELLAMEVSKHED